MNPIKLLLLFVLFFTPLASDAEETKQVLALQSFLSATDEAIIVKCWEKVTQIDGVQCAYSNGAIPHITLGSWKVTKDELQEARSRFSQNLEDSKPISFDVRLETKTANGRTRYYLVPRSADAVEPFHRQQHESLQYKFETQRDIDLPGQWWPHLTLFSIPSDKQSLIETELNTLRSITELEVRRLGLVTFGPIKIIESVDLQFAVEEIYTKTDAMIPARDGVRLYTEIYSPTDQVEVLPIIFLRTPYRVADLEGGFTRYFRSTFRELAQQQYIFAVQDARGRHDSEGKFEWNRPVRHRKNPEAIDASTDAYDSIEWLVDNVAKNNGRVGMLGVSYPGWYVAMALIDPHPALRAASPQASPSDYFIGDDFFHFGAFRLGPSAELPYLFDFDPKENARFPYDQLDTYEFFLNLGPLSNMNARYLKGASPTWDHFFAHPTYDHYWEAGSTLPHLTEVTIPTLNVVGWWDAENLGGALDIYDTLEPLDEHDLNRIVVGPWAHGQWARGPRENLGAYEFGSDTVAFYQKQIEAPFFAHYLKDEVEPALKEATMFQTGSNEWQTFEAWPPQDVTSKNLYLRSTGGLSFNQSESKEVPFVEYVSDPQKPVPYSKRPIMGFWKGHKDSEDPRFQRAGKLWKVEDQRFVHDRPDVVSFVTEPLEQPIDVVGSIVAHLHASTSGTDSDWVVKLIDVYPESYPAKPEMGGYQLMIADDVLRGKFHKSFAKPESLQADVVNEFAINLRTRNHRFRKGHRIMVQIQSSWFPLIDRNPQKFTNIMTAEESDYQSARQRIFCTREHPSHIKLSIKP